MGCYACKAKSPRPVTSTEPKTLRDSKPMSAITPTNEVRADPAMGENNAIAESAVDRTIGDLPALQPHSTAESKPMVQSNVTAKPQKAPQSASPTVPSFDLSKIFLSGKWYTLQNATSEEIPAALNRPIEEGFHMGATVHRFTFNDQQCEMDYKEGKLTMHRETEDKVFDIARKLFDYCSMEWTAEDGIPRPFPEEIETYISGRGERDAQFVMNGVTLVANVGKKTLRDVSNGKEFTISVVAC